VNLIVVKNGQVVVYDDVTLVTPDRRGGELPARPERPLPHVVVARAKAIGDGAQFDQVNWDTITQFGIDLEGSSSTTTSAASSSPTADDRREATAYNVDVITPNDADTMDAGEMNANLAVRPARSARIINITITAVGMTESVS
jgi:hypothetical protein